MKKVIELQNVRRDFVVGDEVVHALRGVSFTIHEGEFVTIMGHFRIWEIHFSQPAWLPRYAHLRRIPTRRSTRTAYEAS